MTRRIPTAVTIAPRGKAFQVVRCNIAAGPGQVMQHVGRPTLVRAEADRLADSIDWRLSPAVILVDKVSS